MNGVGVLPPILGEMVDQPVRVDSGGWQGRHWRGRRKLDWRLHLTQELEFVPRIPRRGYLDLALPSARGDRFIDLRQVQSQGEVEVA